LFIKGVLLINGSTTKEMALQSTSNPVLKELVQEGPFPLLKNRKQLLLRRINIRKLIKI